MNSSIRLVTFYPEGKALFEKEVILPYGEKAILQIEIDSTGKKDKINSLLKKKLNNVLIGEDVPLYSKMMLEDYITDQVKSVYPIIKDWFLELMGL